MTSIGLAEQGGFMWNMALTAKGRNKSADAHRSAGIKIVKA